MLNRNNSEHGVELPGKQRLWFVLSRIRMFAVVVAVVVDIYICSKLCLGLSRRRPRRYSCRSRLKPQNLGVCYRPDAGGNAGGLL